MELVDMLFQVPAVRLCVCYLLLSVGQTRQKCSVNGGVPVLA